MFACLVEVLPSFSEGDNVFSGKRYRDGLLLDLCGLLPSEAVARIGENFCYALKDSNNPLNDTSKMALPVR